MTGPSSIDLDPHNVRQKAYFELTNKPRMVPTGSPYLRRHVDEAMRFAGIAPGARVLDVGCGMGRYTLILAERGVSVEGLDISQVLLDRLRGYAGGRFDIPLHCADIREPPASLEGAFDAVLGFFVLHHLATLDGALVGLSPLLKPGGRMVFLEPNPFNPLYYIQILVTPGMSREGEYGLTSMRRGPIFQAMREAGLQHPALARFGFLPPFVVNRPWGARLERVLEAVPVWKGLLPFQLFKGVRP